MNWITISRNAAGAAVLLAVMAAAISGSTAFAQQPVSYTNELAALEARIAELENMEYMQEERVVYAQPGLATDGSPAWITEFDYLYWTQRNASNQYGITDIGGVQDRGAVGTVLAIDTDYATGFRFAVGRRFSQGGAGGPEFVFRYTDFDTQATERHIGSLRASFISSDNSENDDIDNTLTGTPNTITPDDRATQASALLRFNYQTYDLELAQSLILADSLTLRLSGGGRAADVGQSFQVTYTGGDFQTAFSPFQETEYTGGGLIMGTDLRWYVLPSLTFDIGAKGGLLVGTMQTRTFIPDDEPGVPTDVRYDETRLTPIVEMTAAVTYRGQFRRVQWDASAGYQLTNWFNVADSRVFSDSHMEGQNVHLLNDLAIDGFYARVGFGF
ncbi:MAG: hypothetical protein H8E44_13520 [Planctomycetes bacterium]|nr:hypothetical protein [Planctomycetota bacterium]